MDLKFRYENKADIPNRWADQFTEQDGGWVLAVEGAVDQSAVAEERKADKTKLEEFRATNIAALNENKELKQRFEGIDPEEVRTLIEEKRKLEEEKQLKAGEFENVLATRLKADLERIHAPVVAERDALLQQLSATQIDQAAVSEATQRGLRRTAIPDITARARMIFKLVDGVPQAFDGETVRIGKDGVSPMTVAEWVEALVSDAPHLFEANAGGGAAGSSSGGAGNGSVNRSLRKEKLTLTERMQLVKKDPQLAARMGP